MEEPSHARAISIVLALSFVVGAWLFVEYSNRPTERVPPPPAPFQPATAPAPYPGQPAPAPMAPIAGMGPQYNLTFKCESNGRISYRDKPCGEKEKTVAVTASYPEPPAKNNLQQMQERLAAMEASRAEREHAASTRTFVASATSPKESTDDKALACRAIDEAIAATDSDLRQPHSAERGDDLTAKRKKLTDRRFSLGCN